MSPKEALVIAMKREEGSYRFYQALAALQPPGEIKAFLEKMAQVELATRKRWNIFTITWPSLRSGSGTR